MSDPYANPDEFCPREKTISNLYQRMLQERVVLVRGTPAIGKTAMLTLLFHHIASLEDGPAVYRIASWQEKPESPHLWNWSSYIHSQTYNELDVFHASVSGDRPYALLIDEAQSSYWDLGFWSEFVKGLAQGTWSGASQPHLVMFAAYGSASSLNTVTPPYLSSAQNISLRPDPHSQSPVGLLLDEGEFRDALARKAASKKPPMLYDKHVCKMLFGITQGHAGAMGSLVDSFYNPRYWGEITTAVCQAVASKRCLDEAALESHFANRYICFEALADTTWRRGLPSSDDMRRPHISDLFTYILQEKSLQFTTVTATGTPVAGEENPLSNRERTSPNTFGSTPRPLQSTIKFAHSRGWIHATWVGSSSTGCISYVLPSQLHAWYLSYLLLPSPTTVPLPEIYTAPFDLCWAAIQHFRPSALLAPSCIGPATLPRPHEAIFQDEFYRCAQHVTGNQLMLTPEFGDARGRIDFFLGTPYLWGFELFRFGDRLAEHVGRFAKRGRYTRWVKAGEIAKYVLLNFTTAEENPEVLGDRLAAGKQDKNLYHVVFSEGFTHVQAFDSAFRPVKDRIRLFEGSAIR